MVGNSLARAMFVLLSLPLGAFAQQHASAHAIQYHDSPAGRSVSGGPGVRLLYCPDAQYTPAARKEKVKGTVVLEGTIVPNGCVRGLRIVRSLGYGLDENALYAVQRWKFEARQKELKVRIEVNFDPAWSPDKASLPEKTCGQE